MAVVTFVIVLLLAVGLGLWSRRGVKSNRDFLVGGSSFGGLLLFILVVGEVYSIGTVIGFPGGVYAQGAQYAVWFMGYILLGYPIGYALLPLIAAAGRRYGAVTMPDILRGFFGSRALELTTALVSVVFLIPWAQLQLTGLTVALSGLGLGLSPLAAVLIGVGIALVFVLLAGIKAPAYVSFLKDAGLIVAIFVVAAFVLADQPSITEIMTRASAIVPHGTIAAGEPLTYTVSTLVFQALGFCMFPFLTQAVMSSRSPRSVKHSQIWMPLYMLMYPFLLIVAYYAISAVPGLTGAGTNVAFMEVARRLLPDWLVGVIAGAAALCAIVVLAASSLCIATLVSRNVATNVPEHRQTSWVRVIIAVYLVVSIVLTLAVPSLMGALINTAYYGFTQLVVPVAVMLIGGRTRPGVLAAGLAVGAVAAVVLYLLDPDLGGLSLGVPALAANVVVVLVGRLVAPRPTPLAPLMRHLREAVPAAPRPTVIDPSPARVAEKE